MRISLLNLLLILILQNSFAQNNIKNPVLPGVADAGVLKFNGEYYIGGVFTKGSFYRSRDLMNWEGPFHVFSMNNKWTSGASADDSQIHANDMVYLNGVFHLFWSVNYWGRDRNAVHIAHARSKNVLGPYEEPNKETWVENRIDPKLFIDDDGKAYLYMVKFTDGNTIWVQPMSSPDTLKDKPIYLFSSLPNTWETRDNRVEEGPWVIKYRNRYYLMYNANHTSPAWGNYALGVAEASSPTGFQHGNKYSYPLLQSNQVELEDRYPDILRFSSRGGDHFFQYTTSKPAANWTTSMADSSDWKNGRPGFGSSVIKNATVRNTRTIWSTPEIYIRKIFQPGPKTLNRLLLRINHDGPAEVFLNGNSIYKSETRTYKTFFLDSSMLKMIKEKDNILAVAAKAGNNNSFLDVSLFATDEQAEGDILFSPGQPNILRGPNGFEWWHVYMANRNSDRRGQYIDRIHFFNKRMFAEGVTGPASSGYHPGPAKPTFSDIFDSSENNISNKWEFSSGSFAGKGGEMVHVKNTNSRALIKSQAAINYLFEANLRITDPAGGRAGVIACWQNENNWLKVGLDSKKEKWFYQRMENGKITEKARSLSAGFNFQVYHKVTVQKNDKTVEITIDDRPAPGEQIIKLKISGSSRAGIFSDVQQTAFDGVVYTIGWDEFDSTITGWNAVAKTGWKIKNDGIHSLAANSENSVFKGDLLSDYEFSTQLSSDSFSGEAGVYASYADKDNFLRLLFSFPNQKLNLEGKMNGKDIAVQNADLTTRHYYYPDMKYTDFFEKYFDLEDEVVLDEIFLNKTPQGNPDTVINDIHLKMNIFYRENGIWKELNDFELKPGTHAGVANLSFKPVKADALKFVNKDPGDQRFYLSRIGITERFRNSYNCRIVNRNGKQVYMVNGKEVLRTDYKTGPSKIGLVTRGGKFLFNGIMCYDLPE